jgi:hypothetical protein
MNKGENKVNIFSIVVDKVNIRQGLKNVTK